MPEWLTQLLTGGSGGVISGITGAFIFLRQRIISNESDIKELKDNVVYNDRFDEFKEGIYRSLDDIKNNQNQGFDRLSNEIQAIKK
jgi:hypothetical protein